MGIGKHALCRNVWYPLILMDKHFISLWVLSSACKLLVFSLMLWECIVCLLPHKSLFFQREARMFDAQFFCSFWQPGIPVPYKTCHASENLYINFKIICLSNKHPYFGYFVNAKVEMNYIFKISPTNI